ncbi:MAG: signal peptidase II [Acidobacteria bacterium]|nr:signal peptidase II [Acidobacteriota bacterium]
MSPRPLSPTSFLLLAAVVLILDQATKWLVAERLALGEIRRVIPSLFNLTRVENRGAAFGFLADSSSSAVNLFLIAFSLAALLLVLFLLWRGPTSAWAGCGLGLILGGAAGNLLDRLRAGTVVDFLDFYWGAYHWPAFNLADSAIVLGAGALLIEIFRGSRQPNPQES